MENFKINLILRLADKMNKDIETIQDFKEFIEYYDVTANYINFTVDGETYINEDVYWAITEADSYIVTMDGDTFSTEDDDLKIDY